MKKEILEALEKKYQAEIAEADAIVKLFLEKSVGVADHANVISEVDKQIHRISSGEEKLEILKGFEEL